MLSSYMHDSVGRLGPRRGGVATRPPRLSDASLFPGEHILSIGFARAWQALSCGLPLAVVLFRKSRPWSHDWYQGRDQSEPRQGVVEPLNERALGAVLVKLHEDLPKGKFENEAARNVGGVAGREHRHGLLQLPFEIGPHVAHGGWLKRRIRRGRGGAARRPPGQGREKAMAPRRDGACRSRGRPQRTSRPEETVFRPEMDARTYRKSWRCRGGRVHGLHPGGVRAGPLEARAGGASLMSRAA